MSKYLVFGHKNPDTDTVSSAIAMAYFLEKLGHEAEPVVLGPINEETAYALEKFQVEVPRVVSTVSNDVERVALVDHNEPSQSVDDLSQVTVDYVVDHHRIHGFESDSPLYYRCEPIGCTATILYKMFNEHEMDIPKAIAGLMLSAIISDSLLFKSPTCTRVDEKVAHELAQIADVNVSEYGLELLKAGTNLSDKTVAQLLSLDAKNFDMGTHKVRIAQVNTIGFGEMQARKDEILSMMQSELTTQALSMFLFVVTDVLESNSIGYVVGDYNNVVEKAFNQPVIDQEILLPNVVSRKKQIVPPLTQAFN